jgi:IclR family KDG regulon transcriptional repressor
MKPATTVTKVCRVLAQFKIRPSLGVTDLARQTALAPSDVHRILKSLQMYGYVEQDPETKRYRIGTGLLRLGLTTIQRNVLHEKGRPILVHLSGQMETSAHLAMFDTHECEVFLVDQVDQADQKDRPVDALLKTRLGSAACAHSTALGKTMMASLDDELLSQVLERNGLPRSTGHTITGPAVLKDELQLIRQRGYAVDREEWAEGTCCLGCPVRNRDGAVIGAISVSMPASRFYSSNQNLLAAQVDLAAVKLSCALGYYPTGLGQYHRTG